MTSTPSPPHPAYLPSIPCFFPENKGKLYPVLVPATNSTGELDEAAPRALAEKS
jgi:hypothetical protein